MPDSILGSILRDDVWEDIPRKQNRGPFDKPIVKNYSISICTNCMGRKNDVVQTLKQNIIDNSDYPLLEFVLLDYNSQDGLDDWVKAEMMEYIESGKLVYYQTEEPNYYSMTHSRNIEFKLASGEIVNNVDADHFTTPGFASFVNLLANNQPEKAIFAKGKQKNRGRLGFYKKEFIELLGGYDESIEGYGFDDYDLKHRAFGLGFTAMYYGGQFFRHTEDHRRHPTDNYRNKDWKYTQRKNTLISILNFKLGKFKANEGREWGKAKLIKNFEEEIEI